jgi:uncharacterized integral membrane protein
MRTILPLAFLFTFVATVLALQNTISVTMRFMLWEYKGSIAPLILVSIAVGAALAFILVVQYRWYLLYEVQRLSAAVEARDARIRILKEQKLVQKFQRKSRFPKGK